MEKEHIDAIEAKMAEAETTARNYFRQGLNCSECVYQTILDLYETNLPKETISLATGFGGGMGHTRNTCGAITGAVLSLGSIKGRKNPFEKETPTDRAEELKDVYAIFANMINEIEDTYGTLICKELSAPYGDFDSRERKKNCQKVIGYCASLVAKYAEQANK
ncbi:C_GCAxxG_C_C family protein [Clostridium sp. PL3]|uniref:C_GCAxxG_C_C family protein n=1 Tax=Clostridium thailandense TaxID=2794346 RepID=A0A949TSV2_9CLOT|nr:C-GCAxxG-C-C family protein [Clostridium thailandense]MBV7274737.1 C_GCAxxG_C_C family protein [Clostridium thailandense]